MVLEVSYGKYRLSYACKEQFEIKWIYLQVLESITLLEQKRLQGHLDLTVSKLVFTFVMQESVGAAAAAFCDCGEL